MFRKLAKRRGGAQPEFCGDKTRGEGKTPLLRTTLKNCRNNFGSFLMWCCNYTLCSNFFRGETERMNQPRHPPSTADIKEKYSLLFGFARDRFFLLKRKEHFSLVFLLTEAVYSLGLLITKALNESCGSSKYLLPHPQCFGQVAGLMRTPLGRLGIPPPNPLLPSRSRSGKRFFPEF